MKGKLILSGGWRRLILVAFPLLTVVFSLMLTTTPAWAAQVTNITFPISGTVGNACNGEILTFSGQLHLTASVTLDGSGGFHTDTHVNIHVTATGNLGNTYVGNQEINFELNGSVGTEKTSTLYISEISQGSAPNFVVHALFHITVNPDGTVTAFVDNFTSECLG